MKTAHTNARRAGRAALLVILLGVAGCGCRDNDAPPPTIHIWAEIASIHDNGDVDIAVFLERGDASPTAAVVFVPFSRDWRAHGTAPDLATLASRHRDRGFQIRTRLHERLDARPDEACLAIAVYRPAGSVALTSGLLCMFTLSPAQANAAPETITLELPLETTPIYINETPYALSATTRDARPMQVSTTPVPITSDSVFRTIADWLTIQGCNCNDNRAILDGGIRPRHPVQ